jgi:hypothetical protein
MDRDQPQSVSTTALAGPLGVQGGVGRDLLGDAEGIPVPARHRVAPNVLGAVSALGVPFIARGLVLRNGWMVLFGLAVQMAGKIWFIDRMAILYDDVAPAGSASVTLPPPKSDSD